MSSKHNIAIVTAKRADLLDLQRRFMDRLKDVIGFVCATSVSDLRNYKFSAFVVVGERDDDVDRMVEYLGLSKVREITEELIDYVRPEIITLYLE